MDSQVSILRPGNPSISTSCALNGRNSAARENTRRLRQFRNTRRLLESIERYRFLEENATWLCSFGLHQFRNCYSQNLTEGSGIGQNFVGFYEKVIKVKADVAAVLASATQLFGSGGGHCQGRPAGRSS